MILMTTKKKLLLVRLHGTGDAHLFPQLICCIQMNLQRTMLDGIGNSTSQDPGLLHAKLSVTQSTNLNIIFLLRMRCTGCFTSCVRGQVPPQSGHHLPHHEGPGEGDRVRPQLAPQDVRISRLAGGQEGEGHADPITEPVFCLLLSLFTFCRQNY